jgi:hypothetical protein
VEELWKIIVVWDAVDELTVAGRPTAYDEP